MAVKLGGKEFSCLCRKCNKLDEQLEIMQKLGLLQHIPTDRGQIQITFTYLNHEYKANCRDECLSQSLFNIMALVGWDPLCDLLDECNDLRRKLGEKIDGEISDGTQPFGSLLVHEVPDPKCYCVKHYQGMCRSCCSKRDPIRFYHYKCRPECKECGDTARINRWLDVMKQLKLIQIEGHNSRQYFFSFNNRTYTWAGLGTGMGAMWYGTGSNRKMCIYQVFRRFIMQVGWKPLGGLISEKERLIKALLSPENVTNELFGHQEVVTNSLAIRD